MVRTDGIIDAYSTTMPLSDIFATTIGSHNSGKDGTKHLPNMTKFPSSPSLESSEQMPQPNITLGAMGDSFPPLWSLQPPITCTSHLNPPLSGSFPSKLDIEDSADPGAATDPSHADFCPIDSEFPSAFQYHGHNTAPPFSSLQARHESPLDGFSLHGQDKYKS